MLVWDGEASGSDLSCRGGEFKGERLEDSCWLLIREDDEAEGGEDEEESRMKGFEGVSGSAEWSMSTSEAEAERTLDMVVVIMSSSSLTS